MKIGEKTRDGGSHRTQPMASSLLGNPGEGGLRFARTAHKGDE
jgi:hypothetical protein